MKRIKLPHFLLYIVLFTIFLSAHGPAHAEGSWQFGLVEGLTHAQPLFEYNNSYASPDTGLQAELRPSLVTPPMNAIAQSKLCSTNW